MGNRGEKQFFPRQNQPFVRSFTLLFIASFVEQCRKLKKSDMKTFALLLSFSFLFQIPATLKGAVTPAHSISKTENQIASPTRHQTTYSLNKKKYLIKKRLSRVFAKVKSWFGKNDKRKGTKFGLIGLGLGLSSIFLLIFFSNFFLGLGIAAAIGALVLSILNFKKSFKRKERLWPAILMIIAMIPIIFLSLFLIACFNGCF